MTILTILGLLALAATLFLHQHVKSWWSAALVAVAIALGAAAAWHALQPRDLTKDSEPVFHACGYGIGQLIRSTPGTEPPLLVITASAGAVDESRVMGLKDALAGSGIGVAKQVTLALAPDATQPGADQWAELQRANPGFRIWVSFAGLPPWQESYAQADAPAVFAYTTAGRGTLAPWLGAGVVKGAVVPGEGNPVTLDPKATPQDIFNTCYATELAQGKSTP